MNNFYSDNQQNYNEMNNVIKMSNSTQEAYFMNSQLMDMFPDNRTPFEDAMAEIDDLYFFLSHKLHFKKIIKDLEHNFKLIWEKFKPIYVFIGPIESKDGSIYHGQVKNGNKFGIGKLYYSDKR